MWGIFGNVCLLHLLACFLITGHKRTGSSGSSGIVTSSAFPPILMDSPSVMSHSATAPGSLDGHNLLASLAGSGPAALAAMRSVSWTPGWPQS